MFKRPQPKIDIQLQNRTKPGNLSFPHINPTTPPSPDKGTNHFRAPVFARNKMMAVKTGEVIKELANRKIKLPYLFPGLSEGDRLENERIRLAEKELDARIKAAGFYEMEKQLQSIEEGINQDYFAEFRDFLLGKSKYNKVVHWGMRKLISDDIDKYLEATFNKKAEFDKKLLKMKTTGFVPSNLDEAWFYFNFILKHPDITGEQIEEEFLKPWEAFYPQPLSKFQSQTPGADHDEEAIPRMGGIPEHKESRPAVSKAVLDVVGMDDPPQGLDVYVKKLDSLPRGIPDAVEGTEEEPFTERDGGVEYTPIRPKRATEGVDSEQTSSSTLQSEPQGTPTKVTDTQSSSSSSSSSSSYSGSLSYLPYSSTNLPYGYGNLGEENKSYIDRMMKRTKDKVEIDREVDRLERQEIAARKKKQQQEEEEAKKREKEEDKKEKKELKESGVSFHPENIPKEEEKRDSRFFKMSANHIIEQLRNENITDREEIRREVNKFMESYPEPDRKLVFQIIIGKLATPSPKKLKRRDV